MSETLITIPEYILHSAITLGLKYIQDDWVLQTDKNTSYLRRLLTGVSFQRYDAVTQAEEIFIKHGKEDDPRTISVDMMYNMERMGPPAIHITLPGESEHSGGNGIGQDEGYKDPLWLDDGVNSTRTPIYTRRFQATYNIVITSDNIQEVVLIHHVLKALFISLAAHISLSGLQNIRLGGQDVNLNDTQIPKHIFMRAVTLHLEYEVSAPATIPAQVFHSLTVTSTPVNG